MMPSTARHLRLATALPTGKQRGFQAYDRGLEEVEPAVLLARHLADVDAALVTFLQDRQAASRSSGDAQARATLL